MRPIYRDKKNKRQRGRDGAYMSCPDIRESKEENSHLISENDSSSLTAKEKVFSVKQEEKVSSGSEQTVAVSTRRKKISAGSAEKIPSPVPLRGETEEIVKIRDETAISGKVFVPLLEDDKLYSSQDKIGECTEKRSLKNRRGDEKKENNSAGTKQKYLSGKKTLSLSGKKSQKGKKQGVFFDEKSSFLESHHENRKDVISDIKDKREPGKGGPRQFLRKIIRSLIRGIYLFGLAILTLWDCFEAWAIHKAGRWLIEILRKSLLRGFLALRRLYRRIKKKILERALKRSGKKKYPFKIKLIALLSGLDRETIVLPFTEGEKSQVIKNAFHRTIRVLTPILGAIAVVGVVFVAREYVLGVKVSIDGNEVGVLASQEDFAEVLQSVETYITETTGSTYTIEVSPSFQNTFIKRDLTKNTKPITDVLYSKAADVVTESSGLYINDELVAVNPNTEGIQEMLDNILAQKRVEGERAEFVQKVEIKQGLMPKQYEKSLLEISEMMSASAPRELTYTVGEGDTVESIAAAYGMTVAELRGLNPEEIERGLAVGDTVTVTIQAEPLSVKTIQTVEYQEEIPFETVEVETDALYKGQSKINVEGQAGISTVKAEVTYIDNQEVSRQEIAREVTVMPITKEILVGKKPLPEKAATGVMRRPVGGTITANYGRYSSGRPHTGVDFANPTGTIVVAADGGTVVTAGWSGNYGYCVVIDHGNGLKTRYAHNSALLVKVGQKVSKGEAISRVGSTGNSTGPHCHFEVIKNGEFQNPWNYIS